MRITLLFAEYTQRTRMTWSPNSIQHGSSVVEDMISLLNMGANCLFNLLYYSRTEYTPQSHHYHTYSKKPHSISFPYLPIVPLPFVALTLVILCIPYHHRPTQVPTMVVSRINSRWSYYQTIPKGQWRGLSLFGHLETWLPWLFA